MTTFTISNLIFWLLRIPDIFFLYLSTKLPPMIMYSRAVAHSNILNFPHTLHEFLENLLANHRKGCYYYLAKTNIIFWVSHRVRHNIRVPARLVFQHVLIATFDAQIPTCDQKNQLKISCKFQIGYFLLKLFYFWLAAKSKNLWKENFWATIILLISVYLKISNPLQFWISLWNDS